MSDFESVWKGYRERTESALSARLVDCTTTPKMLNEGMGYVCLGGGKRFRAMLVYACGEMVGAPTELLDTPACAVEMVHAYSLTHDDLPAMDDDDVRRGKPTCHIQFDEATAVLVGDALQSRAFEILASPEWNSVSAPCRSHMVEELARAIGSRGMAGGQVLDMSATGKSVDVMELQKIHQLKTGALIESSAVLGALSSESIGHETIETVRQFAKCIGLAFQIADDILDHISDSETLGKSSGADLRMEKSTYVSALGLQGAKQEARNLSEQAIEYLDGLGDNTAFLEQLSHFVVNRTY